MTKNCSIYYSQSSIQNILRNKLNTEYFTCGKL